MTALSQNESTVQGQRRKAQVLGALSGGQCHLIVCVDMVGEAFDMPNLKIAVFHDNRGSLGPVIQLVGLLARTQSSTPIGPASVFVSRDPTTQFSPLRKLLRDHRLRRSHRPNRAPRYSAGLRRFVVVGALAGQGDPVQRPLVEMQQHTAERGTFCGEPVFDLHRRTGVDDTFDEPARFEVLQAL
jgi:hypothetical protein